MPNHRRNIENISKLFPQITTPLIQSLIGGNINLILSNYLESIDSLVFAQVLYTKYGLSLFDKKFKIFDKWIDSLKTDKIIQLARSLNVTFPENDIYSLYDLLKQELNSRNSKTRVKFFELNDLNDYINNSPVLDVRQSSEKVDIGFGDVIVSKGYPHTYQTEVKIALFEKLKSSNNTYSTILLMPTGSGKTRTAIEYLIDEIRINTNKNILWLVDSPELAEQALQSFKELWQLRGDRSILLNRFFNKFKPESSINFDNGINIVFGTFDKINSEKNNRTELYTKIRTKTNILIIDEAHFSLAATYEDLISNIRNNSDGIKVIGLTATPLRADDNEFANLRGFFNNRLIEIKVPEGESALSFLQENRYLAELETEYLRIEKKFIKEESQELNHLIVEKILNSVGQRKQVILFALSKDHAIALDIIFKLNNIKSECIIGETSSVLRQEYFRMFKDKEINVLLNYEILATGIDLPKVDELFIIRKFNQYSTAMQVLGRALRGEKNGGNQTNKIVSLIDNKRIIQNPSVLFEFIKNIYS